LIEIGAFSEEIVARAKKVRESLVAGGLSKYARSTSSYPRPSGARKVVLVTGQVEDDRSILAGGAGLTNLELLRRARLHEPDAFIIYKPHPDVEAGHRKGRIDDSAVYALADRIEREAPIAALLDAADALHVITSQAGFEALMRGKSVTVHGVPFYAGWGLTEDLGPIPARRTARRTLDELVAATLIHYPRYLDPVTRLPCPPEVLIQRLVENRARFGSSLVYVRRIQGALRRGIEQIMARFV
jgi:capsular polysaccharide export protein